MPVITISRMYGSDGSEVAERVAQTLGWSLFDNAMVDAIAERSGLTRAEVSAAGRTRAVAGRTPRVGAVARLARDHAAGARRSDGNDRRAYRRW